MVDWDELVGTEEAARMLGVSTERVKQLCRFGMLEARKINGGWIISADSVRSRIDISPRRGRPRKNPSE